MTIARRLFRLDAMIRLDSVTKAYPGQANTYVNSAKLKLKRKTLRKVDDEKGKATITGTATDSLGRTATDKVKLKVRP